MAQRPTSSRSRAGAARAQRDSTFDGVLLLALLALGMLGIATLGRWPFALPPANPAVSLTMAQARASNAAVPIDARHLGQAAPYRFRGGPAERAQATDCLATAALYEAGDDDRGQRAVIQVILNRTRAPGFPRTVCGVVYQGYARTTGCQFSFTCDGSVDRRPVHLGWSSARRAARRALAGHVFGAVGRATHYHADWMVPYWRDSLAKIARIGPHLFYLRG